MSRRSTTWRSGSPVGSRPPTRPGGDAMNAPVPIARGRTVRIDQTQRSAATVAGLAFLFTDATATFVQFWVRPATIVDNDAAKTAAAIAGAEWLFRVGIAVQLGMIAGLVTLTAALYMVLRPVGPVLAL